MSESSVLTGQLRSAQDFCVKQTVARFRAHKRVDGVAGKSARSISCAERVLSMLQVAQTLYTSGPVFGVVSNLVECLRHQTFAPPPTEAVINFDVVPNWVLAAGQLDHIATGSQRYGSGPLVIADIGALGDDPSRCRDVRVWRPQQVSRDLGIGWVPQLKIWSISSGLGRYSSSRGARPSGPVG
ncbi:hypothetical protein [Mycobacterium leprae]|uniref:hypothetical protein n=2 Tax=Mycobacterium leprae TaxID=1769 RepID=UPI000ACD5297|nr:hypothetical protein [Mycobacterium leprae]